MHCQDFIMIEEKLLIAVGINCYQLIIVYSDILGGFYSYEN